jgi:hypothetical protein
MRRVAAWRVIFGDRLPSETPGVAVLFLRKKWKAIESQVRAEFAHDARRRWLQ